MEAQAQNLKSQSIFPKLPLLESEIIMHHSARSPLADTAVVAVQHLLETTGSLFETLFDLGLSPHQTFLLGKLYSTNHDVQCELRGMGVHVLEPSSRFEWGDFSSHFRSDVSRLWEYAGARISPEIKNIIVLDDGGFALSTIPDVLKHRFKIAGVEQTTSGLTANGAGFKCPVVEVASSAVKRILEAPIIREAVLRRVRETIRPDISVGVVGLGSIGSAIARHLLDEGFDVKGIDRNKTRWSRPAEVTEVNSLKELFDSSGQIFGCTGCDIFEGEHSWRNVNRPTALFSCSSHDIEFRSVLRTLNEDQSRCGVSNRLSDLHIECNGSTLSIARGGFPVNFDGARESAPADYIQITRALLAVGVIQAHATLKQPEGYANEGLMLEPADQRGLALQFLSLHLPTSMMFTETHLSLFDDLTWVQSQSGGQYVPNH